MLPWSYLALFRRYCRFFALPSDPSPYGFKPGHSTSLCTSIFKQTVDYYRNRGSHVFVCFVDFHDHKALSLLTTGSCLISSLMIISTLMLLNCLLFGTLIRYVLYDGIILYHQAFTLVMALGRVLREGYCRHCCSVDLESGLSA